MNAQKPAETPDSAPSKPSRLDRIKQSRVPAKAKTILAGVGVVTLGVVAVAQLKKKSHVKVDATLPTVDVTTDDN